LKFFRTELAQPQSDFAPFVTVIAPFRGIDDGLDDNLNALVEQNYPQFEIIFVGDDYNDPAIPCIKNVLSPSSRLIIAPKAIDMSQKVENLRSAVKAADERTEVFVFVDSDVRPVSDWLRSLVSPLEDPDIGGTTGYRWFISRNPTFASELRSSWNASIASALGPQTRSNFCWGGSMAIRRDVFERLKIHDRWKGTLSDDFAVTRAMNEAKMPIVFVPQALTASIGNCGWAEMLEFTTRQMKITRVYASRLWLMSLIGSGLFVSVMIASIMIVLLSDHFFSRAVAVITLATVTIFSTAKALMRLKAVRMVLTHYEIELKRQRASQYTFWLLTPPVFLMNSIAALLSRRFTWRGIVYELKSPTETVIISD
jgi:cellulose synthase/poly-beta-1,6-N-acetylglucosamine synthase-like glycosyltransferase